MPARGFRSNFLLGLCAASLALTSSVWAEENPARTDEEAPSTRAVAIAVERIERDRRDVQVFSGNERVELPRFTELLVAKAIGDAPNLETLAGRRVALIRAAKNRDQWEVHPNVVWLVDPLTLPENVFRVKKVLSSSSKTPIKVQVNGETHHLKSGQVLLVLG